VPVLLTVHLYFVHPSHGAVIMISFMEAICNGYRIKLVEDGAHVADCHDCQTGIFIYVRGKFWLDSLEKAIAGYAAAIEEVDRLFDGLTIEDLVKNDG
jgi:hypothetical protein